MSDTLRQLSAVIKARKEASADSSYVASLHHKGLDKILEKVGEEAFETVIAAKTAEQNKTDKSREDVIYETADLWFHSLVMLSHFDLDADDIITELTRRFDLSGLDEKAARKQ